MEPSRYYRLRERPLASDDYDVPVGWWGWNWEPPVPMSLTEILSARNLDARTAALCWMVLEAHGSMLIAAEQPHSGKTTTLTAFLDLLPQDVRRIFLRGWSETFDFTRHTDPRRTILLANELSDHLPVYLWGPKAVKAFGMIRQGYAFAGTLHADSADETVAQLRQDLGVEAEDLARIDLLLVMRIFRVGSGYGALARRVVSVHRPVLDHGGGVVPVPLVTWDRRHDVHEQHEAAQLELLCLRLGRPIAELEAELSERAAFLDDLRARGVVSINAVRAAIAERRGESAPDVVRGDPTV